MSRTDRWIFILIGAAFIIYGIFVTFYTIKEMKYTPVDAEIVNLSTEVRTEHKSKRTGTGKHRHTHHYTVDVTHYLFDVEWLDSNGQERIKHFDTTTQYEMGPITIYESPDGSDVIFSNKFNPMGLILIGFGGVAVIFGVMKEK